MRIVVQAVVGAMVLDIEALKAGVKRYIGYELVNGDWGFSDRPVAVRDCQYIRKQIRRGNLIKLAEDASSL